MRRPGGEEDLRERRASVEGLPVLLVEPGRGRPQRPLALWLTHLGGSKEQSLPILLRLAEAGHPAVSFDPPGHGERASDDPWQFAERVLGSFRQLMWLLLGRTVLESLRVLDWARAELSQEGEVLAGGVSMGGDVTVALAGIDPRISRVAAAVATPDWARPGMAQLGRPEVPIDHGTGDRYACWLRDQLDPMLNLDRCQRGPGIAFECGDADTHVPPDGAERFKAALSERHPSAAREISVTRHAGLDHLGGARHLSLLDGDVLKRLVAEGQQRTRVPADLRALRRAHPDVRTGAHGAQATLVIPAEGGQSHRAGPADEATIRGFNDIRQTFAQLIVQTEPRGRRAAR